MISWLQNVLQKHYKWLFSIILVVIIVSFVFTIGASPGIGRGKGGDKQMLYGYNLNAQRDVETLFAHANISHLLNTGFNLRNNQQAEELALTRPPLLYLANNLQIPKPNQDELVEYIKSKPFFKNAQEAFDPKRYSDFLQMVEQAPNLTEDQVKDTLSEDFRIDRVSAILSGPGYVYPYEAQLNIQHMETLWSLDVATLKAETLSSTTYASNEEIDQYYQENKFNYASPPKIKINYVLFSEDNYLSQVETPSNAELENFYDKDPGLYNDDTANETSQFESAKPKVLQAYKKAKAKRLAAEAASEFVAELYNEDIQKGSDLFSRLLKENALTLNAIEPFSKDQPPRNTPIPRSLLKKETSGLSEQHFYSEPISLEHNIAILFFEDRIPPMVPTKDQIHDKLKEDYLMSRNLKLLDVKRKILDKTFQESSQLFAQKAKDEGLTLESYDKVKLGEIFNKLGPTTFQYVQKMKQGEVSTSILKDDQIQFVFVREKEKPEVAADSTEVQDLLQELSHLTAEISAKGFLNEMVTQQLKSNPDPTGKRP